MGIYLNPDNDKFLEYYNSEIFVDKSGIIDVINGFLNTYNKYMCVTRPRRFGKTLTISMLNAYYSKGCDSKEIFDKLNISSSTTYFEHLNKHNVILVDMASLYSDSRGEFLKELNKNIIDELNESFPNILTNEENTIGKAIKKVNSKTNERFIFLIDEWDVIFREEPQSKLCDDYIMLLRSLFKAIDVSACIDLVYMTGIFPIKRYSTESALNMFKEYNMLYPRNLSEFIGFTENEVKELCSKYDVDFNEMKKWYDGYHLGNFEIYNPQSVVEAIGEKEFRSYWPSTGALESVTNYMNYDNGVLKGKITRMLSGEKIPVNVEKFTNDLTMVDSEDAALTILIHLGYLAYDKDNKSCYIPNYEISNKFILGIDNLKWVESYNPIANSKELLEKTLKGDTEFINETLDTNHKELASMYNKNKEDVLGVIVRISYYYAKEFYTIRKEDTCTTGRADITFTPRDNTHIPLVIELKADKPVEEAMSQIKEKDYSSVFNGYKGKVLLLGITYDSSTLKHESKIEYIEL